MAAAAYKVLEQNAPTTTSETTLYTVGSGKQTIVSTLSIANLTATGAVIDVNVRPAGAAVAAKHAFLRGTSIDANRTVIITVGMTLTATDVISIKLGTANSLAVTLFGTEIA